MPAADPITRAALLVLECLEDMGARQSNPVLEIYPDQDSVIDRHKYPPEGLRIAGDTWRAYYHSHDYPERPADEHGHFHLFHRVAESGQGMENWAHVAGLAMDVEGQPSCFFVVNRWVTDGIWLPADRLVDLVATDIPADESPAARWLLAMLGLFRNELSQLFRERDWTLARDDAPATDSVLEDRRVYTLGRRRLSLASQLEAVLVNPVTSDAADRY